MKLLLIGCGGIGRRWLEGWIDYGLSGSILNITIVEPNPDFEEVISNRGERTEVVVVPSLQEIDLSENIDLAVVATSSNVRTDLVEQLNETGVYCNLLILEKNLCQSLHELESLNKLVKSFNDVRVNCTIRHQPFAFAMLGHEFKQMNVTGMSWGLGCNLIHMLDLFSYLLEGLGDSISQLVVDEVTEVFDSKRSGFKEFHGIIRVKSRCGRIMLCDSSTGNYFREISISGENIEMSWDDNFIEISNKSEASSAYFCPEIYQSQYSKEWLKLLAKGAVPPLSKYEQVADLTYHMLNVFGEVFYNDKSYISKETVIPIT